MLGLGRLIGLARKVGVTLMVSRVAEDLPVDSPTVLRGPAGVDQPLLGGLSYNSVLDLEVTKLYSYHPRFEPITLNITKIPIPSIAVNFC